VLTTNHREALVRCTDILVVAGQHADADTQPLVAIVTGGTRVSIIAFAIIAQMHAALHRVASVVGADIAIVTDLLISADAHPVDALVSNRTRIAIVASVTIGEVHAAGHGVARIIGAKIVILANSGHS